MTSLVLWPILSGVFLGLVAVALALRSGGVGHASEIGGLVGGISFASNALALCVIHRPTHAGSRRGFARQ